MSAMKFPKFRIYKDRKGDWRWSLVAANGKIIADSAEGYVSKRNATRAVEIAVDIAEDAEIITEDK